jgi:hypothetical protein
MKSTKQSTAAAAVAIDDRDLAAVGGGIWGGPDGTWTCTPGVLDLGRRQRRERATRETT